MFIILEHNANIMVVVSAAIHSNAPTQVTGHSKKGAKIKATITMYGCAPFDPHQCIAMTRIFHNTV